MDLDDLELEHWCDAIPLEIHSDDSDLEEEEDPSSHQNAPYYRLTVELNGDSTTLYSFNIPKHELLHEETASYRNPILDKLSEMGVPQNSQNVMKERIMACARDMASWTHVTHKVLPMFVTISLTGMAIDEDDGDDDDEDGMVNMEEDQGHYGHRWVPASEASIERLERVMVGQDEGDDGFVSGVGGCSICFEDFKVGSQVTRMPCLHLYHGNCIVDWLRKTNSCPLCRFLMPPATTE